MMMGDQLTNVSHMPFHGAFSPYLSCAVTF